MNGKKHTIRERSLKAVLILLSVLILGLGILRIFWNETAIEISDLLAILNLILVVILYCKDAEASKRNAIDNYRLYWLKDVVLDQHLSEINKGFDDCVYSVSDLKNKNPQKRTEERISECINQIQKAIEPLNYTIGALLHILDSKYKCKIENYIDDFIDNVSEKLASTPIVSTDKYIDSVIEMIKDDRTRFLKILYDIGKDFM